MSDTLDGCRELALRLAPELDDGTPLYILDAADIDLPENHSCLGFAMTFGTEQFADTLGDRWQGAGRVIALDMHAIGTQPGDFQANVDQTIVHEVAHLVPATRVVDLTPIVTPQFKAFQRARMSESLLSPNETPGSLDDPHDWRFIRRALHLFTRAASLGIEMPLENLFGSWWMVQAAHWLPSVLAESLRMRDATFREIESTPAPAALMSLWQNNLEFLQSCQQGRLSQ